jgi:hypothetical protein
MGTILYGMPSWSDQLEKDIDSGKIVLGGCIIDVDENGNQIDPMWECSKCGVQVYKNAIPDFWFKENDDYPLTDDQQKTIIALINKEYPHLDGDVEISLEPVVSYLYNETSFEESMELAKKPGIICVHLFQQAVVGGTSVAFIDIEQGVLLKTDHMGE